MGDRPAAFNNLPQWAKREFDKLNRQVEDLEKKLALMSGAKESRISFNCRYPECAPQYLKDREPVRFNLAQDPSPEMELFNREYIIDVGIRMIGKRPTLEIRSLGTSLVLQPEAGNLIRILGEEKE